MSGIRGDWLGDSGPRLYKTGPRKKENGNDGGKKSREMENVSFFLLSFFFYSLVILFVCSFACFVFSMFLFLVLI